MRLQIEALKALVSNVIAGEVYPKLLMSVIKFCLHCENHLVKKLLLTYWEVVDKKSKVRRAQRNSGHCTV